MAVNWAAAAYDPIKPVAQGNAYANQIFDQAAQREAGQQYASGDFAGASNTVGARGDFKTAEALRGIPAQRATEVADQKIKQATAQHDYLKQAVPLLGAIYQKAGPTGLNDAFQKMLPEIKSLGTDDATIGQITQAFQTNPEGTLRALGGMAQSVPHQVGKDLVFVDPNTNQEISRIKGGQDAPSGFETAPGGGLQPIKGGPGDPNYIKQNAENKREIVIQNPAPANNAAQARFDANQANNNRRNAVQLRKEFDALPDVKNYNEIANAADVTANLGNSKSAADDMALIFTFMKALDPQSVVREGEFATAQNTTGIPGAIVNAYNKALSGNRLNDQQRAEFSKTVKSVLGGRKKNYDQIVGKYKKYATDSGLPEDTIQERLNTQSEATGPVQIKSDADFAALPSGAEFIAPDGSHRRKP